MEEEEESLGTLAGDLAALLSSGTAADVTIMADGVWLPAHRAVMAARSPVFAAMFRHGLLEASNGSVSITDINQEVLRQLLQFIYTDEAPLLECVAAELLMVADKYEVLRLKKLCEQQVIADLCVENAAASAVLAIVYSCTKLKAVAISFINSHYKEVMATDGWAKALREHTEDALEICRLLGEATRLELECKNETLSKTEDGEGSLVGDLLALLESADSSDVTLTVGGASLPAHRAVLTARSPVLGEELKDTPGDILQVDKAQEEDLRQTLRYMYSDQLPPPESVTDRLLMLANNYGLWSLKEYCEEQLADKIYLDNAVSLAVVAAKNSCSSLKRACVDFIRRNIFEVMDTTAWETALRNDVDYIVEISKCLAAAQRLTYEEDKEEMQQKVLEEAKSGTVNDLQELLDRGAGVCAQDGDGATALHWASWRGNKRAVRCLLKAGAAVDAKTQLQLTPLHLAAGNGHAAVVRQLVAASADVNARNADGMTPLHRAVMGGHTEAARSLLRAGSRRAIKDDRGRTPLELAKQCNYQHVVDILQ